MAKLQCSLTTQLQRTHIYDTLTTTKYTNPPTYTHTHTTIIQLLLLIPIHSPTHVCNHRTNLESIVNLLVLVSNALTRCFSFRKISPHHLRCNPIEKYNLNCSAPSQVCASVFRLTEQTRVNTSLPQTPRIPCKYLRARQNPYHL